MGFLMYGAVSTGPILTLAGTIKIPKAPSKTALEGRESGPGFRRVERESRDVLLSGMSPTPDLGQYFYIITCFL